MRNLLKQIIFEQQTAPHVQNPVERDLPQSLIDCNEILIISGIRRCGKSTLLQQIRSKQTEKDYYLNFDDERLIEFTVNDFQLLHEVFIELFGEQITFYFDEIQNIQGWERFVRRLYDQGNKVFITGSNAGMLSRELGSRLTGRFVQYELYPFSFREYLQFSAYSYSDKDFFTTRGTALLSKQFQEYLQFGGFPQYIANKDSIYIKTLYESIIYRDVMVRNNLSHEKELLELVFFLASNIAKLHSYTSLKKAVGISHTDTIRKYIGYLSDTYLVSHVYKFDYSVKKQLANACKYYLIDNALINRLGFQFSSNEGRLLENCVYIELLRRGYSVYYHSSTGSECDFLVRTGNTIAKAIQVCTTLSDATTKAREIKGILDAMNTYGLSKGFILSMYDEETIETDEKTIYILPAWKWILKEPT